MTFFDAQGNQIQPAQWLNTYERYYFLNGPRRDGQPRNQTSPFVENRVCALLCQKTPLSRQDLILAMAWKLGLIDQSLSESRQKIEYRQDWATKLIAKSQFRILDFSKSIPYLADNMSKITQVSQVDPRYLYDLIPLLKGFGHVYILTVLFFATRGQYPIYDRFAHIAALAIDQGLPLGSCVHYREGQKWSDYQQYKNLLVSIARTFPQQPGNVSVLISRPFDRALWVYGHFFQVGDKARTAIESVRLHSRAPLLPGRSKGWLDGRICDLSNETSDGWKRREINVRQGPDGYPAVRDIIHLIDSSGVKYRDLPFIKGARLPGYVCLGKPGQLRPWFDRHYSSEKVLTEEVYFKPTGQPNEYRIYTKSQWQTSVIAGT